MALCILELFGVPTHGGTVAARCAWRVNEELCRRAEGLPIYLASHVDDQNGRVIIRDGPRSAPLASDTESIVVPLAIPRDCGTYSIQLDAVVEGRFWASSFGIGFPSLRVERLADGGLVGEDSGTGRAFRIEAPVGRRLFSIPHALYGAGESERCVEVPWVLSRYRGERRVLDVGTAYAESRYLDTLQTLHIPSLYALDLVPATALRGHAVVGDARHPPLQEGSIALILAISVIEHIGRNNSIYLRGAHGPHDIDGDYSSIRALAALLVPGGRLLVTVPFGRFEDHGWFVQYDLARLEELVAASGLGVVEVEFFRYRKAWIGPLPPDSLSECRYQVEAVAAAGLACLTLKRERGPFRSLRHRLQERRLGLRL